MREWTFENGIIVQEEKFEHALHCFKVYNGNNYLGTVYPATIENMESCIASLDSGEDPISGMWEDGNGNSCSLNGWEELT